jgi:streptogramin lyase
MHRLRVLSPRSVSRLLVLTLLGSGVLLVPATDAALGAPVPPPAPPATGHIDEFAVSGTSASPLNLTSGPDGQIWFTDANGSAGRVGSIGTAGTAVHAYDVSATSVPTAIVTGPDGNLWYTQQSGNAVAEITPSGLFAGNVALPTGGAIPLGIAAGPPGAANTVWVAEFGAQKVARVTSPAGTATEFPTTTTVGSPTAIATGPDGNLWFTEQSPSSASIGRMTTGGSLTEFLVTTTTGSQLGGITPGPDGNLWFAIQGTAPGSGAIGRISPAGTGLTTFPIDANANPVAITKGPDGNLWFTDLGNNAIGRMSVTGTVLAEFSVPSTTAFSNGSFSSVGGITTGPDGNIWFTEQASAAGGGKIGRLLVQPTVVASPASLSFPSQSVGTTATAQAVTLSASGGGPATITATPTISGTNASDFSVAGGTCSTGAVLVPSAPACTVMVTFRPTGSGQRSAVLSVPSTAANSPTTVALSGVGQAITVTAVIPGLTNFFNQALGTTSTARTVLLGNGGPGSLTVSSVSIAGAAAADFSIVPGSNTCTGRTVAPNATCSVGVVFTPTAEGVRSAGIAFNDNAAGSPQVGILVGRGVHAAGY